MLSMIALILMGRSIHCLVECAGDVNHANVQRAFNVNVERKPVPLGAWLGAITVLVAFCVLLAIVATPPTFSMERPIWQTTLLSELNTICGGYIAISVLIHGWDIWGHHLNHGQSCSNN